MHETGAEAAAPPPPGLHGGGRVGGGRVGGGRGGGGAGGPEVAGAPQPEVAQFRCGAGAGAGGCAGVDTAAVPSPGMPAPPTPFCSIDCRNDICCLSSWYAGELRQARKPPSPQR
jgi:hypothetical protein